VDIYSIGLKVDSRQVNQAKGDLGRFGQQTKKTSGQVSRLNAKAKAAAASTKAMGSASSFATKAVAGLGAALSIRALTQYTTSAINAADSIGKMAQTAGVSAEKLQELRFAFGQLAGTTDSEVDSSLRRFNRRLGLAADGTGAAKDTFGELGVAIEDTGGQLRRTGSVLDDTFQQLAQIDSESRRAAKASEIFGEDAGPKLASALGQGEGAIKNMRQEARDLGIVLNDDAVQSAEALSDQMDILNKTLMVNFQEGLMSSLAGDAGSFSEAIADPQFQEGIETLGSFIGDSLSFLVENADTIIKVGRSLALIGLSAKMGGMIGGRKGALAGAGAGTLLASLASIADQSESIDLGGNGTGATPTQSGGQANNNQPLELIEGPEELTNVNLILRDIVSSTDRAARLTETFDDALVGVGESLADIATSMTDDVSDGLTDIIMQAKDAEDVFASLARQIARTIVQQQVANPLAEGITSFASNLLSGPAPTGSTHPRAVGDIQGSFANGGNVSGGVPAIVGERGPEMFVPRQDGQIVPNSQMGGGGGDVTVNIINQSGEQLQSEQQNKRRGPNGEMTVDVMVKSSMERLDSQGQLDGIFRRHGAKRQGQF